MRNFSDFSIAFQFQSNTLFSPCVVPCPPILFATISQHYYDLDLFAAQNILMPFE